MQVLKTDIDSFQAEKVRSHLDKNIIGQPEAVSAVIDIIEKYHGGLSPANRPIGSLLFLGPTGTGKTQLVETTCEALFGSESSLIKVDCGEFQHSGEIAKLIGSPPGYLGHRETPARLTNEALNKSHTADYPISIILFDEIEKASDALWHILLGVLDKGVLTLGDNRVTKFDKSIIFFTSNAGSSDMSFATGNRMGLAPVDENINNERLGDIAVQAARRKFTPEFLARMDRIVAFNSINKENSVKIIEIELEKLQKYIMEHANVPIKLNVSDKAKAELLNRGFDAKYNGRNLRRAIEKELALPLSRIISSKQAEFGDTVNIDYVLGKFFFSKED